MNYVRLRGTSLAGKSLDASLSQLVDSSVSSVDWAVFFMPPQPSPLLHSKEAVSPYPVGDSQVGTSTTANERRHRWRDISDWTLMPPAARWRSCRDGKPRTQERS